MTAIHPNQPASAAERRRAALKPVLDELVSEALSRGRVVRFAAEGKCMRWLIPPGSEIAVRGCPIGELRLGDLVLMRDIHGGVHKFIAHRTVGRAPGTAGGRFITKGDASSRDAAALSPERCVGRVVGVFRDGKAYRLDAAVWRPLGLAIAALSRFSDSAYLTRGRSSFLRRRLNGITVRGIRALCALGMFLTGVRTRSAVKAWS